MAGGLADVLDVGRAHALLHADRAVVRRRLLAEEVGLERHHAGVDEQQVGVVEQQRRRRHRGVAGPLEVGHEPAADLGGVHQLLLSSVWVVSRVRLELGSPMGHHAEPLPQLGFAVGRALGDLVAEHPGAEEQRAHPVVEPVGGERLGRPPPPDHAVDAGARSGQEPEPAPHAVSRRSSSVQRVALPRLPLAVGLALLGAALLAGALDLATHLEPDPVAGLGVQRPPYAVGERAEPDHALAQHVVGEHRALQPDRLSRWASDLGDPELLLDPHGRLLGPRRRRGGWPLLLEPVEPLAQRGGLRLGGLDPPARGPSQGGERDEQDQRHPGESHERQPLPRHGVRPYRAAPPRERWAATPRTPRVAACSGRTGRRGERSRPLPDRRCTARVWP